MNPGGINTQYEPGGIKNF